MLSLRSFPSVIQAHRHSHSVSDSKVHDTLTDFGDDSRRVGAKNGWVLLDDSGVVVNLPVDRIESRRVDLDEDFARTRFRNVLLLNGILTLGLKEKQR